jgi:hypothetical protein
MFEQITSQFEASNNRSGPNPFQYTVGSSSEGALRESIARSSEIAHSLAMKPEYYEYVGDMVDGFLKEQTVIQMDNWKRATQHMNEATKSAAIANFDKYAFDLIRAVLPEMASERLFSFQSMYGPTGTVFYFDAVYGTTRGKVVAGQKLFENHDMRYGDNTIEQEVIKTGAQVDGTAVIFTGNLGYSPIMPGTVDITDGTRHITDDGNGGLVGDIASGTNTINYASGAWALKFNAAPTAGNPITADYVVNNEGTTDGVPEIDLILTSAPVTARSTKLRTRFSMESMFALRDTMGLSAEAESLVVIGAEIAYGIDTKNIDFVKRAAMDLRANNDYVFDRKAPDGVSWMDHKFSLIDQFIMGSDYILRQSGRATGNKLLVGSNVANVLESLAPRFSVVPIRAARGVHFIGTLDGRWEVFKDLSMDLDEYMILHKGDSPLQTGYIFAPWILSFTTPAVILDDFQSRQGMGSLYGQKMANAKMYLRMKIKKTA